MPTDSFYALAVSPFNQIGLERLMHIKGERSHKPFPVLVGDPSQLDQLTEEIPDVARKLIERILAGFAHVGLAGPFNSFAHPDRRPGNHRCPAAE